ncbi:hypothetical protein VRRI112168_18395 [Vreelandella rituensis]|uniref:Cytochrome c domain-containing protein n=1 Tax=Vreelandella rituensis TaxID=2282306 RepID=A0A368TMY6_9GAMM|nr:hypothetical protein [Halomonas rituensis]RCV85954.1 hypothetical protein DU506_19555 [Halomonas rituensis]
MSLHNEKRRDLLGKLRRQMSYTAPVLALVASGVALDVTANGGTLYVNDDSTQSSTLLLASNHAEAEAQPEAQAEGEAEDEGEAEAEAEAEGEGEAEAEGEGEAEAEAEGGTQPSARTQAVSRPENYVPGYDENGDNPAELVERGEALFNDASLSTNGLACASCHGADGQSGYQASFNQPYPHEVNMGVNQFGMDTVHADEMVQLCMVAPMAAEPLGWESTTLAALAAYVVDARQRFVGEADIPAD